MLHTVDARDGSVRCKSPVGDINTNAHMPLKKLVRYGRIDHLWLLPCRTCVGEFCYQECKFLAVKGTCSKA